MRHKLNYHIYNIALAFCKIQIRTAKDESLSNYKTGDNRSPLRIERGNGCVVNSNALYPLPHEI